MCHDEFFTFFLSFTSSFCLSNGKAKFSPHFDKHVLECHLFGSVNQKSFAWNCDCAVGSGRIVENWWTNLIFMRGRKNLPWLQLTSFQHFKLSSPLIFMLTYHQNRRKLHQHHITLRSDLNLKFIESYHHPFSYLFSKSQGLRVKDSLAVEFQI